jgi:hypothetical protein
MACPVRVICRRSSGYWVPNISEDGTMIFLDPETCKGDSYVWTFKGTNTITLLLLHWSNPRY